jgi:hypothetical protein
VNRPTLASGAKAAHRQAEELDELILRRVKATSGDRDALERFVHSRFRERMIRHLTVAPRFAWGHTILGVIAIAGGVATSTLAAGDNANSILVVVVGLVVASAGALGQIFKYGMRSTVRFRAGNDLRHEGWDYALGKGKYAGMTDSQALDHFYARIWEIEAPADASVELDEPQARQ